MMRIIIIILGSLMIGANAFADALPYVALINGVKAEVFVTEEQGKYILSSKDAVKFGARDDLTDDFVTLENVSANRNELTLKADLPLEVLPERDIYLQKNMRGKLLDQIFGGWINYTLDGTNTDLGTDYSLLTELNISMPFGGVFKSYQINGDGSTKSMRLMTGYEYNMPSRMLTLNIGDAYSSSYALASGQKFTGIQIRRNYQLNPDYIYWPTVTLNGTARAASVYQIFENNRMVGGGEIERGDFAIENYSSFIGESGQVKLVIRDAQGNEQVITRDLYTAPSVLKAGEISYALDAGMAYEDADSLGSDVYGSGSIRYGLDRLTLELGGDFLGSASSFLGGFIFPTGLGTFHFRRSQSLNDDPDDVREDGSLSSAGWEKRLSYAQDKEARLYINNDWGNQDVFQAGVSYWAGDVSMFASSFRNDENWTHTLGLTWLFDTMSISASLSQSDYAGTTVGISASIPLYGRTTAYASVDSDRQSMGAYGTADNLHWSANVAHSDNYGNDGSASVRYDFDRVIGEAYIDNNSGSTNYRGRLLGSIVAASDGVTLAPPVTSGVLLVNTGIGGDIPIKGGGRTHTRAIDNKVVVTNLSTYYATTIQPDFDALEGGYTMDQDRQIVRIPKGMSAIAFDIRSPGFFANVTYHGQPVERGVKIKADGQEVIVTSNGAYIQPSADKKRIEINVGECRSTISVPPEPLTRVTLEVCAM